MDEMIYVFLASGFEEIEALAVVDILRRAELEVQTVAVGVGEKTVRGAHGIPVVADVTEEQAKPEGLEMVVLPGGMPGTLNLEKSQTVQEFLQLASNNGLWIGAICAAPSILGHNGLADGKRVTCYPGFESQLTQSAYTAALWRRMAVSSLPMAPVRPWTLAFSWQKSSPQRKGRLCSKGQCSMKIHAKNRSQTV